MYYRQNGYCYACIPSFGACVVVNVVITLTRITMSVSQDNV